MKLYVLILSLVLMGTAQASAFCDQVRAGVAQYGYYTALVWARSQGYSEASIRQAKACLTKKRRKRG